MKILYTIIAIFMPATSAFAAAEGVDASQVGKLFGGLIVVVAVIFWGAWLAKKFRLGSAFSNNEHLKIVSMLSLGTREKILLLEVGEEQIVIGTSAQGIHHLHTLKTPIKLDDSNSKNSLSFAEQFKKLLTKSDAKKNTKELGGNHEG